MFLAVLPEVLELSLLVFMKAELPLRLLLAGLLSDLSERILLVLSKPLLNLPVGAQRLKKLENDKKSSFVTINMNGIPVGRKIDPKAYDSYERLSLAVDELFRGLMTGTLQTSLFDMRKYGLIS